MLKMKKLTNEKITFSVEEVRKVSMRSWSPMRCRMSPVMRVSKKRMGSFINLTRKSAMMEMLMRELIKNSIHERMKPTAVSVALSIS